MVYDGRSVDEDDGSDASEMAYYTNRVKHTHPPRAQREESIDHDADDDDLPHQAVGFDLLQRLTERSLQARVGQEGYLA